MSQCCGKIPTTEEVGFIVQTTLQWVKRYGNSYQGGLGESVATEHAVQELNLSPARFDKRVHGFDSVMRNSSGKLVIIEAKATQASGLAALGSTSHGREGSVEWVEYKATLMCDPTSSFYTPDNAKIGEEILRVGAENVTFLVIHTDPQTFKTDSTKLR
jgi:hypothetical protein